MNTLSKKFKETMSKYDIEVDDTDIVQIVTQLKHHFKKDLIDKLPTIKEIEADRISQSEITSYINGVADGAKKIIIQLQKL